QGSCLPALQPTAAAKLDGRRVFLRRGLRLLRPARGDVHDELRPLVWIAWSFGIGHRPEYATGSPKSLVQTGTPPPQGANKARANLPQRPLTRRRMAPVPRHPGVPASAG